MISICMNIEIKDTTESGRIRLTRIYSHLSKLTVTWTLLYVKHNDFNFPTTNILSYQRSNISSSPAFEVLRFLITHMAHQSMFEL